ncbi:MAG: hypothetical protein HQK55_13570 [Deltaproteobacteria bacterium]|nr:hypothetical protein [Deltaproteobacteria bacterium]
MAKKLLIAALVVGLVAAFSTSAMAESKVDFSGMFRVRAFYNNNFTLQGKQAWESKKSYIENYLIMDFKVMPTDNLTLNVGLITEKSNWGQQGSPYFFSRPYGSGNNAATTTAPPQNNATSRVDTENDFELRYFWADIKTSVGLFQIGRMPLKGFGLKTLGWTGSKVFASSPGTKELENSIDQMAWTLPSGPWTFGLVYQKKMEGDAGTGEGPLWDGSGTAPADGRMRNFAGRQYDQDWDLYGAWGMFKFATGGVGLGAFYEQIKAQYIDLGSGEIANAPSPLPMSVLVPPQALANIDPANRSIDGYLMSLIVPASVNFGPVGLHAQVNYSFGQLKWHLQPGALTQFTTADGKVMEIKDSASMESWILHADATYNYGPGVVGFQYTYISGDNTNTDYKIDGVLNLGADFYPLLITFDRGLNSTVDHYYQASAGGIGSTAGRGAAADVLYTNGYRGNGGNLWTLIGWVDHSLTEDMLVHAALGYIDVLHPGQNRWNNQNISRHFGTELDVSLIYTLMQNLTFQLDLGYFWAGSYFKQGWSNEDEIRRNAPALAAGVDPSMAKVGNAYAVKSALVLKF